MLERMEQIAKVYIEAVRGGSAAAAGQGEMVLAAISANLECIGWLSKVRVVGLSSWQDVCSSTSVQESGRIFIVLICAVFD